jgi:hypothetical protein
MGKLSIFAGIARASGVFWVTFFEVYGFFVAVWLLLDRGICMSSGRAPSRGSLLASVIFVVEVRD